MKRLLMILGLCATLLGCQRSTFDNELPIEVAGLTLTTSEVAYDEWFTAGDDLLRAPASKVTEAYFQAMDTIGVFIYSGALGKGPYHSTNMLYYTKDGTLDGSTSPEWTAATAMGGALLDGAYSSTAYYPYQTTATNASAVVHSVALDQSSTKVVAGSSTALERSDFMWAPPVAVANPTTAPAAKMVFQHLLTKLVVSVQVPSMIGGEVVTGLNSIAIKNLSATASVNLGTGELHSLTNAQDIKPRLLSGNGNPGTVSTYEAVVVSQTAASGVVLVALNCQTANGVKTANYFPPAAGLALGSGKKITLTLTSAADIAITSELDLVTGQAYNDLPLTLKVASGADWTLTAPTGSWITLATATEALGGTYGLSVRGKGDGTTQTVYVKAAANTLATPRQVVLTLSATIGGTARSVTYTAVQNYSKEVVFPKGNIIMDSFNAKLPAVSGNSNWYIKCTNVPNGMRLSRKNIRYDQLTAADTINLWKLSTDINAGTSGQGYLVSGNYYNSAGNLYIVTATNMTPEVATFTCRGEAIAIDARSIKLGPEGNTTRWARGNLIASKSVAGKQGVGGCRVGAPTDGGLYFQFGSLIGYKGGNQDNGGTGVGMPKAPLTTNGNYWNGVKYDWKDDAMVFPTEMVNTKATWTNTTGPNIATLTDYYFNYSLDWATEHQNIRDFAVLPGTGVGNLGSGRYATLGVGDPCTYYLGAGWLLPTAAQYKTLFDEVVNETLWADVLHWMWTSQGTGYFDPKTDLLSQKLFFPASGYRNHSDGSFNNVTGSGYGWSSSVQSAWGGFGLGLNGSRVYPQYGSGRSYGFPVRCVSSVQ